MSNVVEGLRLAVEAIRHVDGDRDWSSKSYLLVENTLAAAHELNRAADEIEHLRAALEAAEKHIGDGDHDFAFEVIAKALEGK